MFMILIAIQAALIAYANQTPQDTSLWNFVTTPQNWNNTNFILGLVGIAGTIALAGIIAGTIFGFRTDFIIFAGAIAGLISIGSTFVGLYNVLHDELVSRIFIGCGTSCTPVNWILAITLGPIAFYYVWTVIEWWRGKDI